MYTLTVMVLTAAVLSSCVCRVAIRRAGLLQHLGLKHPDTLMTLHNVGCCMLMAGEVEEGCAALLQAATELKTVLGSAHPRVNIASRNMQRAKAHAGRSMYVLHAIYITGPSHAHKLWIGHAHSCITQYAARLPADQFLPSPRPSSC